MNKTTMMLLGKWICDSCFEGVNGIQAEKQGKIARSGFIGRDLSLGNFFGSLFYDGDKE